MRRRAAASRCGEKRCWGLPHALIIQRGVRPPASGNFDAAPACEGGAGEKGRRWRNVSGRVRCPGREMTTRRGAESGAKGQRKRHGARALVCFPICCCASAMSFCASVAVYISCASAGGVKPLPLTSRALVMKVKAMGSHSWMMRLTVLICLRLTTHTSTLCSSPV